VSALDSAAARAPAVECSGLVVRYGSHTAVDGLSFRVDRGEVVALLGPNGAGKTSTVESLEGYRRPAAGSLRVLGLDPVASHRQLVSRIGVMLQRGGVYPMLSPRQVLSLFSRYYDEPVDPEDLLATVGLGAVSRTPWRHLSGGEQQRLSLALALVGQPDVVFLDEPTAGVDPLGRLAIRQVVEGLRHRGAGVLLTTHELAEAEQMADRVLIVSAGRAVAEGTVADLAAAGSPAELTFGAPAGLDLVSLAARLDAPVEEGPSGRYRVRATATPELTAHLTAWLAERGTALSDLRATRSLEETYLEAVAGAAQEGDGVPAARRRRRGRP
jgi:ABC-2 type transport system ATP-binding protein